MRRIGIVATLVVVLLAGCGGPPPGTDGDLTNGWRAMPAAQVVLPTAGQCWTGAESYATVVLSNGGGEVSECRLAHALETAYVGQFAGSDAAASNPPADGSPSERIPYDDCRVHANDYLGGDWHDAMVQLELVVPPYSQWKVGARWYRCDLAHLISPVWQDGLVWSGSVKDGLRGSRPLALTCVATREDAQRNILSASWADCAQPHAAEYVGTFTAPDGPWPAKDGGDSLSNAGCTRVLRRYLGTTGWNESVGYWYDGLFEDSWRLGDRTTRCYAYAYTKSGTMVGSVKGIGNRSPGGG